MANNLKYVIGLFFVLLLVGTISAFDFYNVKSDLSITNGEQINIGDKQITYNDLWEEYSPIQVKNTFGFGTTLYKAAITEHTSECMLNCNSELEIYLATDDILMDDIYFIDESQNKIDIDYNIYYTDEQGKTFQYKVGEAVKSGNYKVSISANKDFNQDIDWVMTIDGDKIIKEWAWWNGTWAKKKALNFSISLTPTIADFQALVNITYDADMNVDFSDLRFTNAAENTELGYYIQSKVNSTYAMVWIRLPTNVTTTSQTLAYMYYGKPGAATTSSNYTTFTLFDDFDATNSTLWTAQAGSESVGSGLLTLDEDWLFSNIQFGPGRVFEVKYLGTTWTTATSGVRAPYLRDIQTIDADNNSLGMGINCANYDVSAWKNGVGAGDCAASGATWGASDLLSVVWANTTWAGYYQNTTFVKNLSATVPSVNMNLTLREWGGAGSAIVDWVRVRGWNDSAVIFTQGMEEPTNVWTLALNTKILAYYKLDESGGSVAYDSTGAYDGIIVGGMTLNVSGKIETAYTFDGNDGYVNISSPDLQFTNQNFSINLWVYYLNNGVSYEQIITSGANNGYALYKYNTGGSAGKIGFGKYGVNEILTTETNLLPENEWTMVTLVYDQSNDKVYIYSNGQPSSSNPITYSSEFSQVGLYLGKSGAVYYEGKMDEIGFWNRTLNDTEIGQLYNSGNAITYSNDFLTIVNSAPLNSTSVVTDQISQINFSCNATGTGDINITSIVLNVNTWTQTISGLNTKSYNATFTNDTVTNGTYTWYCTAHGNYSNTTEITSTSTPWTFNKYVTTSWSFDLNTGLVNYYRLDENSGLVAVDILNNKNGTTKAAGVTINQTGLINRSYLFDGVDGHNVEIPVGGLGQTFTVSAWINLTNAENSAESGIRFGSQCWSMGIDSAGHSGNFSTMVYNGGWRGQIFPNQLRNNTWYNMVGVANTSGSFWYLNGVYIGTTAYTFNESAANDNKFIGGYDGGGGIIGKMDEVAFWNRSLSNAEITQLYNSGAGITYNTIFPSLSIVNSAPSNASTIVTDAVSQVSFSCNATSVDTNITSIVLNVTGPVNWTQTISGLNTNNYNATFTNDTVINGSYTWNCLGYGTLANGTSTPWTFNKLVSKIWRTNLNTNLLVYYKLDETTGTTVIDSTGKTNSINNGSTINRTGILNTAYYLNKTASNSIDFPDNFGNSNSSGSISIWVKTNNVNSNDITLFASSRSDATSDMYRIIVTDTGVVQTQRYKVGTNNAINGNISLTNNTWNHVVVTASGSAWKVYVNGIENSLSAAAGSNTGTWLSALSGTQKPRIGLWWLGGTAYYSNTTVDEFALWDRVINSTEVLDLYNNGAGLGFASLDVVNTAPLNNAFVSGSTDFKCNATGTNGINITSIVLNVTGPYNWTQTINSLNTNSYNATFTNSTILEGIYLWNCIAYGNLSDGTPTSSASLSWTFYKDTTQPLTTITYPLNTTYNTNVSTLNYTASDTYLDKCWYSLNGGTNSTSQSCNQLNKNLTSYYKLDETSGTTAQDSVGDYNGTNTGATVNLTGKINKAYNFTNDYINIGNAGNFSDNDFTINMWIYPDSIAYYDGLFGGGLASGPACYAIYLDDEGDLVFGKRGTSDLRSNNTARFTTGSWQMMTIIYNATGVSYYKNGNYGETIATTDTFSCAQPYYIGAGSGDNFNGLIDEVGIWNRALTNTELLHIYNATNGLEYSNLAKSYNNFTALISNEGPNTWTVYANDSTGNVNSSSVTFFKDTVKPLINQTYPANGSYGSYGNYSTSDGLVAYYKLDNNDFSNIVDINSPLTNQGTSNATGIIGDSRDVNNSKWLNRSLGTIPNGTSAVSVCFWNYPRSSASSQIFRYGGDGTGTTFGIITDVNKYTFVGWTHDFSTADTFTINQWNFICALQYNSTYRELYVNGVLKGSLSASFNINTATADREPQIGNFKQNPQNHNGLIDELGIWNRPLTNAEISRLYNNGKGYNLMPTFSWTVSDTAPSFNTTGLAAYFRLNEATGTTVYDALGINNATNNNCLINQSGKINSSYYFNGVNSTVNITSGFNYAVTNISYGGWFKTDAGDGGSAPIFKANSGGNAPNHWGIVWSFAAIGSSGITAQIYTGTTLRTTNVAGNYSGQWYHVMSVYNGTHLNVYVNGTLKGSTAATGTINANSGNFYLGTRPMTTVQYYKGYMDEVGVWNKPLSAEEVTTLYNSGAGFYYADGATGSNSASGIKNTTIYVYNQTALVNQTTITSFTNIFTSIVSLPIVLVDGVYNWFVDTFDFAGNYNSTANQTFTIDSSYPSISVLYPSNTTYNTNVSTLNYTTSDTYLDKCWYSLNGGTTNSTAQSCGSLVPSSLTNNIIAYYNLDNDNFNDSLGNYNLTNNATTNVSGIILDGRNYTAPIGSMNSSIPSFSNTSDYSFSAWIYPTDTGTDRTIVTSGGRITNAHEISIYREGAGANKICFQVYDMAVGHALTMCTGSAPVNTWSHVVITGNSTKSIKGYINGLNVANGTDITTGILGNDSFVIGASTLTTGGISTANNWVGKIDEVGVWNRTLNETDIQALYNSEIGLTQPFLQYNPNGSYAGLTSNEGPNTWTVYSNDSAGNINSSSVTFFKDTINPLIIQISPANGSYLNTSIINFNWSVNDSFPPLNGTGLLSYYKLDETSGTVVIDSNVTYNGTNVNALINQPGIMGTSYYFDRSGDYITMDASPIKSLHSGSISMWVFVNATTDATPVTLFSHGTSSSSGNFIMWIIDPVTGTVQFTNDGNPSYTWNNVVRNNTWTHIVVTSNDTYTSLYVNGVAKIKDNIAGADGEFVGSDGNQYFTMGALRRNTNIYYMFGRIDEVAFWDRAITQSEVTSLYTSGSGVKNTTIYVYNQTNALVNQTTIQTFPSIYNANVGLSMNLNNNGRYNWYTDVFDNANNYNSTNNKTFTIDTVYPTFSNVYDNSNNLTNSGIAQFNITVGDSNGTVILNINSQNILATNLTNNIYNVSYNLSHGNYTYNWTSYGTGPNNNTNTSANYLYVLGNVSINLINPGNASVLTRTNNATLNISLSGTTNHNWSSTFYNATNAGNRSAYQSSYEGNVIDPTKMYDGNWSTAGYVPVISQAGSLIQNFTGIVYGTNYTFRYSIGGVTSSITMGCYNYTSSNIIILYNSGPIVGDYLISKSVPNDCISSGNVRINVTGYSAFSSVAIYEGQMDGLPATSLGVVNGVTTSIGAVVSLVNLAYGQVFKWFVSITDGVTTIVSPTYEFTPNNEPALLNLRIENINLTTIQVFWENEPNMDWVSFRIGNDIIEVRSITSTADNWTVTGLYPNQEYTLEFQTGDSYHAISDYHGFQFRTLGWHPGYADYPYRRLISVNGTAVGTDKNNYAVNVSLNEDNFQYFDGVNWVYYPSFLHLNYTTLNDIRFIDYYDLIELPYNVTYKNIPQTGGLSYQTIPNSNYTVGGIVNPQNAHDGLWNTNAVPNIEASFYYNYTIPVGAKTNSMFRISDSGWGWDIQLPLECYGPAGTDLAFRSDANRTGIGAGYVLTYCLNQTDNSSWILARNNSDAGPYFFETMMTWQYDSQVNIEVIPMHFDNAEQDNVPGIDGNYNTQFWMYYGDADAVNNESTLSPAGVDNNPLIYGDETGPTLVEPIIFYLNDTVGRTATGTNISWSVNQIVDNRLKISTNPYLIDSYFYSYVTNTTQYEHSLLANQEHVILTLTSPSEYMNIVNVTCSNASYSGNYTVNATANPVTITIPGFSTEEFLDWNFTYQENKTYDRQKASTVWPVTNLTTNAQYWYEAKAYGTTGNGSANGTFILGTLPAAPLISILNYSEYRPTKTVTICANLNNSNNNSQVNISFQYWNQTDTTFKETPIQNVSSTNFCYQETANISTSCGGLNTGSYDFGSCALLNPATRYFYINYTKPSNSISSSLWQIKHGVYFENVTLPLQCWNAYSNKIVLRMYSQNTGQSGWTNQDCYNGTSWISVGTTEACPNCYPPEGSAGFTNYSYDENYGTAIKCDEIGGWYYGGSGAGAIWEEAMYWDVSNNFSAQVCQNINVSFGEINNYRAKAVGINTGTTGYSEAYTNEVMPIQELFAGNTVEDNNDAPMDRQYCPPNPDGTVNLSATCYEQKGYREGSLQEETSMYVETNASTDVLTLHLSLLNGTSISDTVMDTSIYGFKYLTLNNLGTNWYTFYITSPSSVILNWTKPGLTHMRGESRIDTSKYVSFNGTSSPFNYTLMYFNNPGVYNTSVYQWCQVAPGGNLFDCMGAQYWGTNGIPASLAGTAYDRGQFFRGGVTNGEEKDSGLLNYNKANNSPLGDYRQCFAFTVYYLDESIIPNNNITNYHYVTWRENQHFSDYNGRIENATFDETYLFNWEYDTLSQTRDWKEFAGTNTSYMTIVKSVPNTTFNSMYSQSLMIGSVEGFELELKDDNQYNFGLYNDGNWINQQIGKYQQGYVILNLPDNATLNILDSDNDELNDFDEVYTYYTNPKSNDTDEDGMLDGLEIANGYDPLIYLSHAPANITLITPSNNSFNNTDQNFTANVTTATGIDFINLFINNVLKDTYTAIGNVVAVTVGFVEVLPDGIYSWFYEVVDITGLSSNSTTYNVTIDKTLPGITILYPQNTTYNYIPTAINYTYTELYPASCWYNINGTYVPLVCGNNITGLSSNQGINIWKIRMQDNATNINETNTTFFVDSINPSIQYINTTETSGSYINRTNIQINISSNDTNIMNITIKVYNSTFNEVGSSQWLNNASNNFFYNYTSNYNGIYYFNATACDFLNNCNSTLTRNVTVDTIYPLVQIVYPLNIVYDLDVTSLYYVLTETYPRNCWYTLNNGTTNVSVTCGQNITDIVSYEGWNTWRIYVNDSAGHINFNSTTFLKDTVFPSIDYISPTPINTGNTSINNFTVAVNINSSALMNVTFNLFNSAGSLISGNTYVGINHNVCYQESANTSNQTGIDGSCGLNYTGNYYPSSDVNSLFYINYTKPSSNVMGAVWMVKHGGITENITLPTACFNQSVIRLSADIICGYTSLYCYNGASFISIGTNTNTTGSCAIGLDCGFNNNLYDGNWETSLYRDYGLGGCSAWTSSSFEENGRFYEEAMIWNMTGLYSHTYRNVADGKYYYNVTASNIRNINSTETRAITIDTTYPTISYSGPTIIEGGPYAIAAIWSNMTGSDTNLNSIYSKLEATNGTVYSNTQNLTPTGTPTNSLYYNWTGLAQGIYRISGYATDIVNHTTYINNLTINIDNDPPVMSYKSPTPNNETTLGYNEFTVKVESIDTNLASQTIYYWKSGESVRSQSSTTSINTLELTGIDDGVYYYNASAVDSGSRISWLGTRNVNVQYANQTLSFCKTLAAVGGNYVVTENLTSSDVCLNVTAPNVNINCQGNTITGNVGILANKPGLTLRNCVVVSPLDVALKIQGNSPASVTVYDSTFTGSIFGIYVAPEANLYAHRIIVTNNNYGIYFNNSNNGNTIDDIYMDANLYDAMTFINSSYNVIGNLTILNSADLGDDGIIVFNTSTDNLFSTCSIQASNPMIWKLNNYSVNNNLFSCYYGSSSKDSVDGTSHLIRSWPFTGSVLDKARNKMDGASVRYVASSPTNQVVYYNSSNTSFINYTRLSGVGYTNSISEAHVNITEYMNVYGTEYYSSPYYFNASYNIFAPATATIVIDSTEAARYHQFILGDEIASNSLSRVAMWLILGIVFLIGIAASIGFFIVRMREGYSVVDIWKYFIILVIWLTIFTVIYYVLATFIMGAYYPKI